MKEIRTEVDIGNNEQCPNFKKHRAYCFTSYEKEPPDFNDRYKYLCYSPEICPTTGKDHWQGYFVLKYAETIKTIQNREYKFSYLEGANGSASHNRIYCGAEDYKKNGKIKFKNDEFKEYGTLPEPGKRNDLIEIRNQIFNGEITINELRYNEPYTYHMYGRTLSELYQDYLRTKKRTEMTEGIWIWGPTGVGKSKYAYEHTNEDETYILNLNDSLFWEGYEPLKHKTVILNEFRGQVPFSTLLEWVDRYHTTIKQKGKSTLPLLAKTIIITSCMHPSDVYINVLSEVENLKQLNRRFKIIHLKTKKSHGRKKVAA